MEKKKLCSSLCKKKNNHCLVFGSILKDIYVVIVNTVFNKDYVTIPSKYWGERKKRQILRDKPHQINQTTDLLYNVKNRKKSIVV